MFMLYRFYINLDLEFYSENYDYFCSKNQMESDCKIYSNLYKLSAYKQQIKCLPILICALVNTFTTESTRLKITFSIPKLAFLDSGIMSMEMLSVKTQNENEKL